MHGDITYMYNHRSTASSKVEFPTHFDFEKSKKKCSQTWHMFPIIQKQIIMIAHCFHKFVSKINLNFMPHIINNNYPNDKLNTRSRILFFDRHILKFLSV